MIRLQQLRRSPMTLAPLAFLAIPFGCGSGDAPTVAEVPPMPTVVADAPPVPPDPVPTSDPMPPSAPAILDGSIQQAAGELKAEAGRAVEGAKELRRQTKDAAEAAEGRIKGKVRDARGQVEKQVEAAEAEAKARAKTAGADARKAAEDALDNLLGAPR